MEKKRIFVFIFIAAILMVSGHLIMGYIENSSVQNISTKIQKSSDVVGSAPEIEITSVSLTGSGSLIDVRYVADNPLKGLDGSNVYIIDHATGRKLGVTGVARIGELISRSKENRYGYFIINNVERTVANGSWVTVVIGNFSQEMTVSE